MENVFETRCNWDEEKFSFLFEQYFESLCFFADRYTEDMDLSKSVVQSVFVNIWTKRNQMAEIYSVKSFLFIAVRNKTLDFLRKDKRSKNVKISSDIENSLVAPF
ncbi:sigma factor [Mangrovibacterium lignilyticum]|uniref:sigma factor n=1 Tax=Mangrovibacterium lignilyticum TaxID=2668052 RepID=UPI0013CF9654